MFLQPDAGGLFFGSRWETVVMKRNSFLDSLQSLKHLLFWLKSAGTMMALRMTGERRRPLKRLLMSLHLLFITLYVYKGGEGK